MTACQGIQEGISSLEQGQDQDKEVSHMQHDEIEGMQDRLARDVFGHTHSPRKAAGRALGTLVEIVTYYLLRSWNLRESISIEMPLKEYANQEITHNVEYVLHGIEGKYSVTMPSMSGSEPITVGAIKKTMQKTHGIDIGEARSGALLSKSMIRNSCHLNKGENTRWVANYDRGGRVTVSMQRPRPYMIVECKRVGQDAHHGKGPQAIEKAKQGSYVARAASSLQKIRDPKGNDMGIIYDDNNDYTVAPYDGMLQDIIYSEHPIPHGFVLTVGVVSNHGNWFTSESQNKEMKVLTRSYDWLLFLTDHGLTDFVDDVVLSGKYKDTKVAFLKSYAKEKTHNQFTKTRMNLQAHRELESYFSDNMDSVEKWFSVIAPPGRNLKDLRSQIDALRIKAEVRAL